MTKDQLFTLLLDQQKVFGKGRDLIDREVDLGPFCRTGQVVVVTGIRRGGKSSLLYLIKKELGLEQGDYLYVNCDDERIVREVSFLDRIYQLHIEKFKKEPVLFLDEVQEIPLWEKFVNRLHEKGLKIFVTGSNSSLLSSEIATTLTGRNKTLRLFPFSFAEFLRMRTRNIDIGKPTSKALNQLQSDLLEYLQIGGFPLVSKEMDTEILNEYFQDIFYRDIIARYSITRVNEIRELSMYFFSNPSRLFSYSALQKLTGIKSSSSIKNYLEYMESAYLFYYLRKFDYSVRRQFQSSKKVYSIDTGLCNRLGFSFSENKGRLLENTIFLELHRRGYELFYYKGKGDCDFVVRSAGKVISVIQVCWEINEKNMNRELNGLMEARNELSPQSALLICADSRFVNIELPGGIELISAPNWLLSADLSKK